MNKDGDTPVYGISTSYKANLGNYQSAEVSIWYSSIPIDFSPSVVSDHLDKVARTVAESMIVWAQEQARSVS